MSSCTAWAALCEYSPRRPLGLCGHYLEAQHGNAQDDWFAFTNASRPICPLVFMSSVQQSDLLWLPRGARLHLRSCRWPQSPLPMMRVLLRSRSRPVRPRSLPETNKRNNSLQLPNDELLILQMACHA